MTQVVTELVIDGRDATSGAAVYEQAMARVEAAHEKATAAQQRQATMLAAGMPQSVDRASAAFAKLQASIDPVSAASHRASLEMTRALALVDRAVMLGVTTQIEADATISRLRDRQIADIDRVRQAQLRLNDTPANDNVAGRRFNTSNLSAQGFDVITTAGFMPFYTVALQQGPQVAQIFNDIRANGEAIGPAVAGAFAQLINPISLVTIGIIALLAAAVQFVDWGKLAAGAVDLLGSALETIAPYAAIAAAGLALLYAPAIITGLVSAIALVSRLGVAATIAGAAMLAANPAVALVAGITIAVAAANIFRDELTRIFGVDIVGAAKDAANFVLNSFTAAASDLTFIWNNFGDIMGAAVVGGVNLAIKAVNGLLQKAAEGIDWLIEKLNQIPGVDIEGIGAGLKLNTLPNPAADRLGDANADHAAKIREIMSRDTIGDFGAGISRGASAASDKLKELSDWLTTVDDKTKKKGGKTDAEKYDDIVDGANRRIAALKAEQEGLGLTEEAAARLRYEQDLLNQAQQKGISLTATQKAELAGLAAEIAATEAQTRRIREIMDFAKDLTKGFIDDLQSGLEQGKTFWESFGNAALNVLQKIADKLLDGTLEALFEGLLKGSKGGGILGELFGWLFNAKGNAFESGNVIPFAKGGIVSQPTIFPMAKGAGLMGEAGPEAIMPLRRGPDGRLGVSVGGGTGGARSVRVSVGVSVDDDGKLQAYVKSVSQETMSDGIDDFTRTLPDHIEAYQADPRRRSA